MNVRILDSISNWAQKCKKKEKIKKINSSSQAFIGNARVVNIRKSINVNHIKRQRRKGA